ncbi:MAG: 30S ribosomal protein S8 [Phycisphaeraceae bacterium]|nr:30S ribosomal protein S8 [Phycisphaeraceae bacterium]
MSLTDTIADMLTRIRNGTRNRAERVDCRNSKICTGIAQVLKEEGYIDGFDVIADGRQGILRVALRYGPRGEPTFHQLRRRSKPGCRVYVSTEQIPRPMAGLGIAILSTSKGVLSDRQAREARIGGELLCTLE